MESIHHKVNSYKISFCTVSMNRLHHLKLTLRKNIQDNIGYGNIEFVVLDYNSDDGMEEWIKYEFSEEIRNGLLVYLRTPEPQFFHRSHSRNISFRMASGQIVCNIDADNFTGKDFAKYINRSFKRNPGIYLVPDPKVCKRDCVGRVCLKKEDLYAIGGYDEAMSDYGYEDNDLYNRLKLLGREEKIIEDQEYLTAITHDNDERYQEEKLYKTTKKIYLNYISPEKTEMLILKNDCTFNIGNLITDTENEGKIFLPYIAEKRWLKGNWKEVEGGMSLEFSEDLKTLELTPTIKNNHPCLRSDNGIYFEISDPTFFNSLLRNISLITNQQKLKNNLSGNRYKVNEDSFGRGRIFKNFKELVVLE